MFDILFPALGETIYMSFVATFFAVLIGFFLAIILINCSQKSNINFEKNSDFIRDWKVKRQETFLYII